MPESPAPPARAEPILEIKDLTVSFPAETPGTRRPAVQRVGLELHAARTTAVVGESGSGKSVTALSILRLLQSPPARYESGQILFKRGNGERIDLLATPGSTLRSVRGGEIAMIFQEPMTSLNPVISIGDQIIEAIRLHRDVSRREAVALAINALREVDIREPEARLGAYPHEFSGGMRQRVMIAIALSCEPRLLIADEPTTALDVTIQAQILELIGTLRMSKGLGVMLITHDLGLVDNHADHVVVMYSGRVVESGPVDSLIRAPRHPYTRGLLESAPRLGDKRDRLRTLDSFTSHPERLSIKSDAGTHRAWWPGRGPLGANDTDEHGVMLRIGPKHHVRIWNA
ncbi:MAG: ABC transporter ATP-binding protein [Phycisphaerales bacterium]|nr:ABC transporter ATP-binding protein [Phycisphaerales bacterium]